MDIHELRVRRAALEAEMHGAIAQRLDEFKSATGVSISRVSVNFISARVFGKRDPEHLLVGVKCDIDI